MNIKFLRRFFANKLDLLRAKLHHDFPNGDAMLPIHAANSCETALLDECLRTTRHVAAFSNVWRRLNLPPISQAISDGFHKVVTSSAPIGSKARFLGLVAFPWCASVGEFSAPLILSRTFLRELLNARPPEGPCADCPFLTPVLWSLSTYIVGRKSLSTFDRQNLHYFLADVDRLPLHHERCALLAAAGTMALESFDGELLVDAIGVCDSMREGGGIKELADYFTAVVKRLDVKKKIRDNAAAA